MNEANQISRVEMLINRIRQLKKESVDLEFIKYLNDMETRVINGEFPIEYCEGQIERNYRIYLQRNVPNQNTKKDYPDKNTFEFNIGAFVLGVVGVLFIMAGLVIFAINYVSDSVKGLFLYAVAGAVILVSEIFIKRKLPKAANVFTAIGVIGIYVATIVNSDIFHAYVTLAIIMVTSVVSLIVSGCKDSVVFKFVGLFGSYISLWPTEGVESNAAFVTICIVLFILQMLAIFIPLKKENNGYRITGIISNIIYMPAFVFVADNGAIDNIYILIHIGLAAIVFYTQTLKTSHRKDKSTTVFLIMGTFIYYVAVSKCLQNLLWEQELAYVIVTLGIFLIIQLVNRIKPIPGVAASVLIATFISYLGVVGKDAIYGLLYLAAFAVCILVIRNWKLLYQFVITIAFVLYPLANSGAWTNQWQSELNVLIVSGMLIALFLAFNHMKWLESQNIKVYNIVSIFVIGVMQLTMMTCDNIFVFVVMLLVGLLVINVLLQERYYTAVPKKDIWTIAYLTYMGIIFPVDSFAVTNIIMTMIALCSVIIGFCKKEKPIRIYGLLLALFICAKIVIYDYKTVTQMQRILLFIGVGVVILIISFVYMWLEKRLQRREEQMQ